MGLRKQEKGGSHIVMQKQIGKSTITVPVSDHKEIKKVH